MAEKRHYWRAKIRSSASSYGQLFIRQLEELSVINVTPITSLHFTGDKIKAIYPIRPTTDSLEFMPT
jgi:hypothetical protein